MIEWLTGQPGLLMFGNCCLMPVAFTMLGMFLARRRPRFRSPVTFERGYDEVEDL